jgi:hypothetical protein
VYAPKAVAFVDVASVSSTLSGVAVFVFKKSLAIGPWCLALRVASEACVRYRHAFGLEFVIKRSPT